MNTFIRIIKLIFSFIINLIFTIMVILVCIPFGAFFLAIWAITIILFILISIVIWIFMFFAKLWDNIPAEEYKDSKHEDESKG